MGKEDLEPLRDRLRESVKKLTEETNKPFRRVGMEAESKPVSEPELYINLYEVCVPKEGFKFHKQSHIFESLEHAKSKIIHSELPLIKFIGTYKLIKAE